MCRPPWLCTPASTPPQCTLPPLPGLAAAGADRVLTRRCAGNPALGLRAGAHPAGGRQDDPAAGQVAGRGCTGGLALCHEGRHPAGRRPARPCGCGRPPAAGRPCAGAGECMRQDPPSALLRVLPGQACTGAGQPVLAGAGLGPGRRRSGVRVHAVCSRRTEAPADVDVAGPLRAARAPGSPAAAGALPRLDRGPSSAAAQRSDSDCACCWAGLRSDGLCSPGRAATRRHERCAAVRQGPRKSGLQPTRDAAQPRPSTWSRRPARPARR